MAVAGIKDKVYSHAYCDLDVIVG